MIRSQIKILEITIGIESTQARARDHSNNSETNKVNRHC